MSLPRFTGKHDITGNPLYEGDMVMSFKDGLTPHYSIIRFLETEMDDGTVTAFFIPKVCEKVDEKYCPINLVVCQN